MAGYRMDSTPTDLAGVANQARAWIDQLQGQLGDAGAPGDAIKNGLQALASAIDAITAAKGKAAILVTDPTLAASYKLQKARDLVGSGYADATRAALDLSAALDAARQQLEKALMPRQPSGADAAMMAFQADQVAKTLEASGDRQQAVQVAAHLLEDALASGDSVTAYLIAGGPMQLLYKRKEVNMAALAQEFARVIGKANAQPASGGVALLPVVSQGGSGTLRGLADAARYAITREQSAYTAWLQASASVGAMRGIWDKAQ